MLPGITTRLVKAMKRSFPSQSHKIKSKCLQLWSNSVTSLMQDANIDKMGENIVETYLNIVLDRFWLFFSTQKSQNLKNSSKNKKLRSGNITTMLK